jgi:MSHA biogenesis protein MshP
MKTFHPSLRHPQRGFTAVAAVFILVVLTALGAFILSVGTGQQIGSALDVQGVRVYEAARSGVEWGLYRQLRDGNCAASSSFTPAAPTLTAYTVTVACTATPGTNGGPTVWTVTSTACNQPNGGVCPNTTNPGNLYVERRVDVSF